jgi:hypothetical protein
MTAKAKGARLPPPIDIRSSAHLAPTVLTTPETRREQLCALGERVGGHIHFMCQADGLRGVSAEAKERALSTFHERLASLEQELARIREDLQLE